MAECGQIYGLIGKAIKMIGAIGKDKKNPQQGFMYRGIDQVYNTLNPVMSELGIFLVPEVLEQKREERTTLKGGALIYTILTIKFTVFAPDGSSVSMVVVGEGMDSGDKSTNKAMSVAMKYAMFQLFCIPTEEMKDPDAEVHEVTPRQKPRAAAQQKEVSKPEPKPDSKPEPKPESKPAPKSDPNPAPAPDLKQIPEQKPEAQHVTSYLKTAIRAIRETSGVSQKDISDAWNQLMTDGVVPFKSSSDFTLDEAETLVNALSDWFKPEGDRRNNESA